MDGPIVSLDISVWGVLGYFWYTCTMYTCTYYILLIYNYTCTCFVQMPKIKNQLVVCEHIHVHVYVLMLKHFTG